MTFTAGYKVNEGTQYEFTVSNETLAEVVQDGGITDGHIAEYCYTALYDSRIAALGPVGDGGLDGGAGWMREHCAGVLASTSNLPNQCLYNDQIVADNACQVYERNFLYWSGTIYPGTENAKYGDFLVMDIKNIKNWYMDYDEGNNFVQTNVESSAVAPGYTGSCWYYESNSIYKPQMKCNNNNPQLNPDTNLHICNVFVVNDELWVGRMNPSSCGPHATFHTYARNPNIYSTPSAWGMFPAGNDDPMGVAGNYYQRGTIGFTGLTPISSAEIPPSTAEDVGSGGTDYEIVSNGCITVGYYHYADDYWGADKSSFTVEFTGHCLTVDTIKEWQSWCGLMFYFQGTYYKPIIEGGIVVGYSSDMNADSEYDDMSNVTGNNIPSTPPTPPQPDPDYNDDPWSNIGAGLFTGTAGAFAAVIALSNAECESLAVALNSVNVPTGFDPMPNILGMKYFPFDIGGIGGTDTTVQFSIRRGISTDPQYEGGGTWDTGATCRVLSSTTTFYDLGYVDIPNRMSERGYPFADYQTGFEAYIPFCGVFPLNADFIMGRRLKATLYVDVMNGTCTGVIYAYNGTAVDSAGIPIAMGSGVCSVNVPVSSSNYGMANAEFIGNAVKTVFAVGTAAMNMKSGNTAGVMTSVWEAGTRAYRTQISLANNLTSSTGFGGDQSSFFLPPKAYVKIVRPRVARDGNYAKSHAYPVCTNGSLRGHGFCIAVNPDLTSIQTATDSERAEMYQLITTGVYT